MTGAALEIDGSRHSGSGTIRQAAAFSALAEGQSRFRIPEVTDHLLTCAWLAELFFEAGVTIEGHLLTIDGVGYQERKPAVSKDSVGEQ